MSGHWSATNRAAAGNATATQSAPTSETAGGGLLRVTGIQVAGPSATLVTLTDSAAGVIWQMDMPAAGTFSSGQLDLRAAIGSNLTLAFSSSSGASDVNMQGDYVPSGYPRNLP